MTAVVLKSLRPGESCRVNGYLCEVQRQARRTTFVRVLDYRLPGRVVVQLDRNALASPFVDERPVHQPPAPDAPIPGHHHYSGCDPDYPRVNADGKCESCGERACPDCGLGDCPGCEVA